MPRLSDLPEPYAIVVMLPSTPPASPAVTVTVNGHLARIIAWLLDNRPQIEQTSGNIAINFGDKGFDAQLTKHSPYTRTRASVIRDEQPQPD